MNVFDKAIEFAVKAHGGMFRKGGSIPYIVHPLEAAAIAAGFTDDPEILAAAVLHDAVEDTPYTYRDICELFGQRIANLVASDSEDKREDRPAEETWKIRKQETLDYLKTAPRDEKIVAFSDKLSNLRALHRDYLTVWEKVWDRFNQKDPREHLWYYGSFLEVCEELSDYPAYREYEKLFDEIASRVQEYLDYGSHGSHLKVISSPESGNWVLRDDVTNEVYTMTPDEFYAFLADYNKQSGEQENR